MRRSGCIESRRAELNAEPLGDSNRSVNAQVKFDQTGREVGPTRKCEASSGHGCVGPQIEPQVAGPQIWSSGLIWSAV